MWSCRKCEGDRLAERLVELDRDTKIVFMSGYNSGDPPSWGRVLPKPIDEEELLDTLRELRAISTAGDDEHRGMLQWISWGSDVTGGFCEVHAEDGECPAELMGDAVETSDTIPVADRGAETR
jgi:hypothetical protein